MQIVNGQFVPDSTGLAQYANNQQPVQNTGLAQYAINSTPQPQANTNPSYGYREIAPPNFNYIPSQTLQHQLLQAQSFNQLPTWLNQSKIKDYSSQLNDRAGQFNGTLSTAQPRVAPALTGLLGK